MISSPKWFKIFHFMSDQQAYKIVLRQTNPNVYIYIKTSICFLTGAGRSLTPLLFICATLTKPLRTLRSSPRRPLHLAACLSVVECLCMALSHKDREWFQLVHLYLKCARKIEILCCSKFYVTKIYHCVNKLKASFVQNTFSFLYFI